MTHSGRLAALLACVGIISVHAKTAPLGDWGEITVPDACEQNKPFDVTVTVKQAAAPTKLVVTANWKNDKGGFGGFLHMLDDKAIDGPGTYTFNVTITKTKPRMKDAVIAAYLSPDGQWKTKTAHGAVDIPWKTNQAFLQRLAEESERTEETKPFFMKTAPRVAELAAGGFSAEPSFTDDFNPDWKQTQKDWRVATWKQNGAQMALDRCEPNEDGHLVLTVLKGEPYRGGSLQSDREFSFGRWVARVRPTAEPGVLNSIFTKDWDDLKTDDDEHDGNKAEVDIELLSYTFGSNSGEAHIAIHLKGLPNLWHKDVPLDFNPSDEFHEWGFDILKDRVVWHVDGKFLAEWKYSEDFYIDPDYEMFFNAWTMPKWIKGLPAQDADYHIDWVKFWPLVEK